MLPSNAPADSSAQRTIQIPGIEILPRVQPAITVGEVLRMVVRSNQQGQGQLYFRGLLIPAALPESLKTGDKIFAKVTEAGNQLVLKLLETQKGPASESSSGTNAAGQTPQTQLTNQIANLVKGAGTQLMQNAIPLSLPNAATVANLPAGSGAAQLLTQTLGKLQQELGNNETYIDPKAAQNQLIATTDGKVAISLRQTADQIRTLLGEPTSKVLISLKQELSQLLDKSAGDNKVAANQIETLIKSLNDELKDDKHITEKERQLIKASIQDLRSARSEPEKSTQTVETSLFRLQNLLGRTASKTGPLDPSTKAELQQMAARLEQLATGQETLNKLNPVMQAIGEPALLLFPFLAQGLLSHSEVSIKSELGENGNGGGRGREYDDEENSESDTTPYQRIQVSVPLPTMGSVHVDIAHRKDEILVRFSVPDSERGGFLLEQLEHLGSILRGMNFKKTELMTHVGEQKSCTPDWCLAGTGETIVA